MGKSTISMAIFHSYVSLPEGTTPKKSQFWWSEPNKSQVWAAERTTPVARRMATAGLSVLPWFGGTKASFWW